MTSFEWFLLIVVVIVVPLTIAVVVTLWTIDQANKRKRANRKDAQIGVKRKAALSPEEAAIRLAERKAKQAEAQATGSVINQMTDTPGPSVSELASRREDLKQAQAEISGPESTLEPDSAKHIVATEGTTADTIPSEADRIIDEDAVPAESADTAAPDSDPDKSSTSS